MAKKTSAWPGWGPKCVQGFWVFDWKPFGFWIAPEIWILECFPLNPRAGWWLSSETVTVQTSSALGGLRRVYPLNRHHTLEVL